jgi:hypothetical protein
VENRLILTQEWAVYFVSGPHLDILNNCVQESREKESFVKKPFVNK